MITLGICNGETASVCLVRDGKLIGAASEERLSRRKMDESFPALALSSVLKANDLGLEDVDGVAYSWKTGPSDDHLLHFAKKAKDLSNSDRVAADIFVERIATEIQRDTEHRQEFLDWVEANASIAENFNSYRHHESHAASAALFSPFDDAMVLTLDGRGDFESGTFSLFNRSNRYCLEKLEFFDSSDSLGFFYGRITGLLGFTPCRHEGKITGLAAHGDPDKAIGLMRQMIDLTDGTITAKLGPLFRPFYTNYDGDLIEEIGRLKREDVAAAAQQHLEDIVVGYLKTMADSGAIKSKNLGLAGGVFGNVRLTHRIKESELFENVFVQPQMGDGGLCLGAAGLEQHTLGLEIEPIKTMYLGSTIKSSEMAAAAEKIPSMTLEALDQDALISKLIEDLLEDKVIGLVRGRMEFGPRALCHRSILYKTSDPTANDWLNQRMNRTEFMPFAPVVRREDSEKYFQGFEETDMLTAAFMTSTFYVTDIFARLCPAVTHIDNTARPQIVRKNDDPFMWKVLFEWEAASGEPALINTSFNAHEEPIVCTEEDALGGLTSGMIDVLYTDALRVVRDPGDHDK